MVSARTMQRTRELNLEGVFAGGARVFQSSLCGFTKAGAVGGVPFEGPFSFERAPWLRAYASQRDADVLDLPARHLHDDGGRRREQTRRPRGRAA